VPPELKIALEVRCAQERRSVSDAVTEALDAWMKAGAK
jgi:plasmid stability protein